MLGMERSIALNLCSRRPSVRAHMTCHSKILAADQHTCSRSPVPLHYSHAMERIQREEARWCDGASSTTHATRFSVARSLRAA